MMFIKLIFETLAGKNMEKLIKGNNGITTICLLGVCWLCYSKIQSDAKEIEFQHEVNARLTNIEDGMWASHIGLPPFNHRQSSNVKEPSDVILADRKLTVTDNTKERK